MEIIKNKEYVIEIYDIGEDGEGIGRIEDFVVFVDKALPGEKVLIKLIKVKKSYGYGKLLSVLDKSPFRTKPVCEVFKRCGGCSLQHLEYSEQLKFKTKKVKDSLERIGGFSGIEVLDTIGMEKPYNYRNKAQFPVGISKDGLSFGFYAPRSHNIINISKCFIQNEINEKIISAVKGFMLKYNIPPYDEQLHEGVIRHIVTRTAVFTKEIMVCIVIKGKTLPKSDFLVEELLKIKGVTSILLNYNNAKTNVIMGNKIDTLYGKAFIEDYIGEFKFEISPFSFFQVNPVQTQILYRTAFDFAGLTGTETVIDAYCGIGTISLFVSRKAKKVIGVEVVSEAVSDARRNALINGVSNVEFVVGKAEEVIPALWESHGVKPDVIFLDPPRKGCDARLIDTLLRSSTSKIVYVSCNPSTLARDLRLLSDKYSVVRVQPVDMFCMTAHVETIICLSRKK
ncbi:MAG: 23S rRNA (uracil(1939)-C(5))-methyltransferase RlmD [Clostridiales bacterium]|nr:23S rRNA (uracil(1939)-C(5))-methyltransferase RlmD [Clostridiales bacterium]